MSMQKRNVCAMYFSATGTTERVVTFIADRLAEKELAGSQAERFDFTLPQRRTEEKSFCSGDVVVFGVPVYAGRVPNVLLNYLSTVRGNGALVIPVVLYGNRNYDDGLIELRDQLEADGFHTVAAAAFVGEHSFSKVLAAGRPDEADLQVAEQFADRIAQKLVEAEDLVCGHGPVEVNGQTPLRGYYQPRDRSGTPVDIRKVRPKTRDFCTGCGLCAEVCPMGSIDRADVTVYTGICIKCGACIKKCPKQARYYDHEGYLYHQHELEEEFTRRAEPELFI